MDRTKLETLKNRLPSGVTFRTRGRGWCFMVGDEVRLLREFTSTRIDDVPVETLIQFAQRVDADYREKTKELRAKIDRVNRELAPLGVRITTLLGDWAYQHEGLYRSCARYLSGTIKEASEAALIDGAKLAKEQILQQVEFDRDGIRYEVETKEIGQNWKDSGFRHRVVCSDGRFSGWARYEEVAYLDNVASLTPYFVGGDKAVTRSITEALSYIAVGPENVTAASAEADSDIAEGEQAQ